MIRLDAATVLLQWSAGGLFFLWVTTRRRIVGLGYGWLLRSVYGVMAVGAVAAGRAVNPDWWRDAASAAVAAAAGAALVVSVRRRRAGVTGGRQDQARRRSRVAAMTAGGRGAGATGPGRSAVSSADADAAPGAGPAAMALDPAATALDPTPTSPEFPPWLDLVPPAVAVVGLVAAAVADGGPHGLAIVRTLVGAAFLGGITDAMLLGHWYLVQPGLGRGLLNELVRLVAWIWPFEVAALLWPTGMVQVLDGRVNDSYGGLLGWFWVACAATTIVLCVVTRAALKERYYSAVMSATGLLYLAILTGFGTDLVARAVLAR